MKRTIWIWGEHTAPAGKLAAGPSRGDTWRIEGTRAQLQTEARGFAYEGRHGDAFRAQVAKTIRNELRHEP